MQESKTTSNEGTGTSSKCIICGGTGESPAPFSQFFTGTLRVSEFVDRAGKLKKRVRIEIIKAMIDEAMKQFDHGEKVAIYMVPLDKLKQKKTAEELGEMLE
jgi:hypothetical protein